MVWEGVVWEGVAKEGTLIFNFPFMVGFSQGMERPDDSADL